MIKFNDFYCLLEAFGPSYRKDAVFLSITVYFSIFVYIFYAHFSILSSTNSTLSTFTKESKCGAGGLLKFMNIYKITFTNFRLHHWFFKPGFVYGVELLGVEQLMTIEKNKLHKYKDS